MFLAARTGEALTALGRCDAADAQLLRARCLLRLGEPAAAADALRSPLAPSAAASRTVEYRTLLATSLARCGMTVAATARYAEAERETLRSGGTAALELALCRADDARRAGNLLAADRVVATTERIAPRADDAHSRAFGVLRAQLHAMRSILAIEREDYASAAPLLVGAWTALTGVPEAERDVWVAASVLRQLAPLVWELGLLDEAELLHRAVASVPWTHEIAPARYVAHRALAWSAALAGDDLAAFARFRDCIDLAPAVPWRVSSTLDRAYLAAEMRQTVILKEEMMRAGELARSVKWESAGDEESSVLLEIAEAYARDDAGLARHWLDRYEARGIRERTLPEAPFDRRRAAMEDDARAAVLAAEGRLAGAVAHRRAALAVWAAVGHGWRGARTAVALARLTHAGPDVADARRRTATFHGSWLARTARRVATSPDR
ncbi:MAG TPA: hypothetical protein VGD01_09960 [Candidatus Elarobacter sp.]